MIKKWKNILAIGVILIFYVIAIIEKASGAEINMTNFFAKFMPVGILGLLSIYGLNKYLLKSTLRAFKAQDGNLVGDIAFGLLLLSFAYFIISLGNITYFRWITVNVDRSAMINLLVQIFENNWSILLLLGPFVLISEAFSVFSRAFILNNLWKIGPKAHWVWLSIIFSGAMFSLLQFDQGIPSIINAFLIYTAANILYFKYRRVLPLLIAGILIQIIDLASFWIYYING